MSSNTVVADCRCEFSAVTVSRWTRDQTLPGPPVQVRVPGTPCRTDKLLAFCFIVPHTSSVSIFSTYKRKAATRYSIVVKKFIFDEMRRILETGLQRYLVIQMTRPWKSFNVIGSDTFRRDSSLVQRMTWLA